MDMGKFYVAISCVYLALLLVAIVLWAIESRFDAKNKKAAAAAAEAKGLRLTGDDVILKVNSGKVEVLGDLPATKEIVREVIKEVPVQAAAEEEVVEPDVEPLEDDGEDTARYAELGENSIVFERGEPEKQTFAEKFAALPEEDQARFNEVEAYILQDPLCRKIEAPSAITYKYKTGKIARVVIKRGVAVFNFMLANTDLNRFVREEGIKNIKIAPVAIRLEDDGDAALIKQTVDIALANIKEDAEYRKEKKKERRRLQKEQERAEAEATAAAEGAAEETEEAAAPAEETAAETPVVETVAEAPAEEVAAEAAEEAEEAEEAPAEELAEEAEEEAETPAEETEAPAEE